MALRCGETFCKEFLRVLACDTTLEPNLLIFHGLPYIRALEHFLPPSLIPPEHVYTLMLQHSSVYGEAFGNGNLPDLEELIRCLPLEMVVEKK